MRRRTPPTFEEIRTEAFIRRKNALSNFEQCAYMFMNGDIDKTHLMQSIDLMMGIDRQCLNRFGDVK